MSTKRWTLIILASVLSVACGESSNPAAITRPSFAAGGVGRPSVLVNPNSNDAGTAKTIREGIEMVAPGGRVSIVPGTYEEALVIDKGLTLEGIGGESGPVVIAPPGALTIAVQVATSDPVTIRDITVQFSGANGIRGDGVVDVTVERAAVLAATVASATSTSTSTPAKVRTSPGAARFISMRRSTRRTSTRTQASRATVAR